jgi:hypothetical protein
MFYKKIDYARADLFLQMLPHSINCLEGRRKIDKLIFNQTNKLQFTHSSSNLVLYFL